ncbi:MAG: acetyl-CoA carboxylase, carboxyltransferase subunit beta [bacterium]|nr:acetyl-CoA carboxylase, carboxyltransferase subunit beta [bacterium]
MAWFKKPEYTTLSVPKEKKRVQIPDGLWTKCEECSAILDNKQLEANLKVCPKCGYHFRISAKERIAYTLDTGSFVEFDAQIQSADPLEFTDSKRYPARIAESVKKLGINEAIICGEGKINGIPVAIGIMEFGFIGGSMGSVVGEKVTRTIERGLATNMPVVIISTTGGARMQEGILSLMQMAKTSAALSKLAQARIPYISVLTNPTTAGVMASYASLGDVVIAEPKALIGFAGPRVIEQTIRQQLPPGFQRSEFLLEHGFIDIIVDRRELKNTIAQVITLLTNNQSRNPFRSNC